MGHYCVRNPNLICECCGECRKYEYEDDELLDVDLLIDEFLGLLNLRGEIDEA